MRVLAKRAGAFVTALMMAAGLLTGAAAVSAENTDTIDFTKTGSITVDVITNDTKMPVEGATIAIIQVAKVENVGGNPQFVYTSTFENCGFELEGISEDDPGAASLAASLASYITGKSVSGKTGQTDSKGAVSWSGLELGLYLVVNTKMPMGYNKMKPFLITVPRDEFGTYEYDVNAIPKSTVAGPSEDGSLTPTPTPSPTPPDEGGSSNPTPTPSSGGGNRIPQTGQLWWPVIALAAAGLVLIVCGIIRKKNGVYEA